jgi:hypothetical protein
MPWSLVAAKAKAITKARKQIIKEQAKNNINNNICDAFPSAG